MNQKSLIILFIINLFLPSFFLPFSYALQKKTISSKQTISPEIKSIQISSHYAHVQLKKIRSKKNQLIIHHSIPLEVRTKDSVLLISEKNFPQKKYAKKIIKKKPSITVHAPSQLPITITLFSGEVSVSAFWKTDLSIMIANKGTVRTNHTKGALNIYQREGQIKITSHKGSLNIQSEDSKINLYSCEGNINLQSFKGKISVNKSTGSLFLSTFKSPLILNHFTGSLKFHQEKGGVYLKPMIGSISGYSNEGEIRGAIHPHQVNIETKKGAINLDLPHSKAWVTAQTWEGKIYTPIYFHRIKTGGMDRSKGQLRGSKNKAANVSLKSYSGVIRVHQSTL